MMNLNVFFYCTTLLFGTSLSCAVHIFLPGGSTGGGAGEGAGDGEGGGLGIAVEAEQEKNAG